MSLNIDNFIRLIYNLLPKGWAWNDDPDSDTYKLIASIAEEFLRVHNRLEDLIIEIDPFQTNELLDDWDAMLGLPAPCWDDLELSSADRRQMIIQTLAALGGANSAYFENLLNNYGFNVTVTPYFSPFLAGISRAGDRLTNGETYFRAGTARAGDRLYNSGWTFWWRVHSATNVVTYFRAGQGRAGDRLAVFGNERLECIVRKLKPAHTSVQFTYGP